jgi:hypothetical protein
MTPEEQAALDAAEAAKKQKEEADAETARKAAEDANKKSGPTDAEAKLLKEVMEKKEALKKTNEELAQVREALKAFEGIDAAKVKALLADQAALEEKKLEEKGQWDALKKQMNDAHAAELAKKDDSVKVFSAENESLKQQIADLTVGNAFGNSKFIAEELALSVAKTKALFGGHFETQEGKVVAFDKPAGSKGRTMLVDGKGEPLSFEDALKKIVDTDADKDQLLKSKTKPGAASTSADGKGGKPANKPLEMSGLEKIKAGLNAKKK